MENMYQNDIGRFDDFFNFENKISDKVKKNSPSLYYIASLFSLVSQQKLSVNKVNGRNNVF